MEMHKLSLMMGDKFESDGCNGGLTVKSNLQYNTLCIMGPLALQDQLLNAERGHSGQVLLMCEIWS